MSYWKEAKEFPFLRRAGDILLEQEIIPCECAMSEQTIKHTSLLTTVQLTLLSHEKQEFALVPERWLDSFLRPHSPTWQQKVESNKHIESFIVENREELLVKA